jgi:hypothetical protein
MKKNTPACFRKFVFFLFCISGLHSHETNAQTGWMHMPTPDASAPRNWGRGIWGRWSWDLWTVGSFEQVFTVPPYYKQNDLIMHWNGSAWFTYPPMNLSTTLDDLWDVEAIAPDNVWAVGIFNGASDPRAEILHFDGSQWTAQNPPNITGGSGLFSMDATAANDIWAAGAKTGSPTRPAYVQHYNGSSWSEIAVPPIGLYRNEFAWIDAISPTAVWAGGFFGQTTGDFHALVMRWNGSTWQNVPLPSNITSPQSEVISLKAISDNDVWVLGYYLTGGGFKLHWNGSSWAEIPDPNGGGGAFAALAPNNVFSVGSEIWHWDGSSWTVADPLAAITYPALVNTVTFPNGDIWACGISMGTDNSFHTLVYRNGSTLSTGNLGTAAHTVKLFPNPANDHLTAMSNDSDAMVVTVIDSHGKILKSLSSNGMNTLDIHTGSYSSGIYFLRIEGKGFAEVKKFIISN